MMSSSLVLTCMCGERVKAIPKRKCLGFTPRNRFCLLSRKALLRGRRTPSPSRTYQPKLPSCKRYIPLQNHWILIFVDTCPPRRSYICNGRQTGRVPMSCMHRRSFRKQHRMSPPRPDEAGSCGKCDADVEGSGGVGITAEQEPWLCFSTKYLLTTGPSCTTAVAGSRRRASSAASGAGA